MNRYNNIRELIAADFQHINGVQVYRNEELEFELYQNNATRESRHPVGCIFKSFLSAAVGTAIRDGLIQSADQKIIDFFPQVKPADPQLAEITIRHALTKTTGIAWPGPGQEMADDTIQAAFSLAVRHAPGSMFEYKPDPQLLVYLLEERSGINAARYIKETLFDPLEIEPHEWKTSMAEIQELKLTMHETARLGQLYLHEGCWQGQQIIPRNYLRESLLSHVENGFPEQYSYGYLWWTGRMEGHPVFFASGFGGQYLAVIPEQGLVAVIASQMDRPHPENRMILHSLL